MNRLQVAALLTTLVDQLRERGGWCGETHIQKSVFVAQELAGVPLGFDFILYKHGPFSFDLRDELTSLRADGLLKMEPQPIPYGPKFKATDSARALQQRFPKTLRKHRQALEFVAENLANKQVDQLERLATALYATIERPDDDSHEQASWINERKPHVSVDEALEALQEVDSLVSEFHELENA
jgi:uncharacterized protein YwgA